MTKDNKSVTIIIDTREKANKHITNVFDKFDIPYIYEKLDYGDYSCMYFDGKKNVDLRDIISIERKSGLDEIATNFTKGRTRFENEFKRHKGLMILAIESNDYSDLVHGKFRSKMTSKSLLASIHSWSIRYNVPFVFIPKDCMAIYIYTTFKYMIKELNKD